MHKLKTPMLIAAVLLLGGLSACASGTTDAGGSGPIQSAKQTALQGSNNAYDNIPADQIETAGTDLDYIWEPKDPFYGFNKFPIVARVHIETIDGGRTFSPVANQYVFPQTVGKMTVREVYKGDIETGTQVNYSRVGGTVIYDDYWNSLNKAQQEKILRLNGGSKPSDAKFIKAMITDDIDIETGKEYLVFLLPQKGQDGAVREYSITGYQHGLREVKGLGTEATVLNNDTQTWERLDSFVKLP
ncbi:hypothetical protein M1D89_12240 [Arthrobacter sp. D3-18]